MHFNLKSILVTSKEWDKKDIPIYKRIYLSLKELIINESISNKTKLPPTRLLAKDLNVSRSTILKAFELLVFERFITTKKGSGYFVNYEKTTCFLKNKNIDFKYPNISKRAKSFTKNKLLITDNLVKTNIAFRPGLPPLDIFPIKTWKSLSNEYWRQVTPSKLSYAPVQGVEEFRITIANYLKIYRNIECDYNQIIIVSGSLHSLYLVGNSVINARDTVIMENPTFPKAYKLFKSLQAKIIDCDVDKNGMQINKVKDTSAKLIYCTPSNQYPLGIKMSKTRRLDLLCWANKNNSLIIEDDYDHEFSNWDKPIPSLYSLDKEERVIYQGTFNKLLHPSLRLGYMIVPQYLINPICSIYEQSSRFVNVSNQIILNNFIKKDFLNKHIRKVISVSLERKKLFIDLTKDYLKPSNNDGLHIVGEIHKNIDDEKIYKELLKNDVVAYPLSNYYINNAEKKGLVLGYSSVNEKVMKEKTQILKSIFRKSIF